MRKSETQKLKKKCILCKFGSNCVDNNCSRSHSEKEVKEAKNKLKEETCYNWMRYNDCGFNEDCLLLHGFKELKNYAPYTCALIKEIQIRKLSKYFDIFPNGNILIQCEKKSDGFCLLDSNGKLLLNIYPENEIYYNKFHIIDNETLLFSDGKILSKAKLININENLKIQFTCLKELENKLINDFFKILPNGNIILINGKNLEIINQNFDLIKSSKIPMDNSKKIDISKYAIFVSENKILISTSFKKTYIYDFELNLLSSGIDEYFKDNSIIEIDGKIRCLWYEEEEGKEEWKKLGSFKFNEYSSNMMEKKEKKLKYKITSIYKGSNNQYFIGKIGIVLIFYSTIDLRIVGYCQFANKLGKVMIKNEKIFVLFSGEKIEIYSINENSNLLL